MKIFNEKYKRFDEVKSLKNVCFKSHPGWKFFVHRAVDNKDTFNISEASTGASAKTWCGSVKAAVEALQQTLEKLPKRGAGSLKNAVNKTKKRILSFSPETKFPINDFKVKSSAV